jgi:fructokinase
MIVVAGEALIDLIPGGDSSTGSRSDTDALTINPGGGPFNTARWLSCLGETVSFLGALAADPLGRRLRRALAQAGVGLDLAVEVALPTTLALAQLDEVGAAQYRFYAEGTSVRGLTAPAVVGALSGVERLTALHLGGVALVLAPSSEALECAAALARDREALVLLDPNVRPGLIADRSGYLRRFERVLACTDVVKLSGEDLAWLAPGVERDAAVDALLAHGPAVVLLTDGGEGVSVHFGRGFGGAGACTAAAAASVHVAAEPVDVVDTIGAGDAFGAGFLAHLLRGAAAGSAAGPGFQDSAGRVSRPGGGFLDPRGALHDRAAVLRAARFATRIAGIACRQRGAEPPATLPVPGAP